MPFESAAVAESKLALIAATGLSKDALHVYVGLAAFVTVALLSRRPVRWLLPWMAALVVASTGEIVDLRYDLSKFGSWRWWASLHDVLNTMFWPTVLALLARYTALFGRGRPTR